MGKLLSYNLFLSLTLALIPTIALAQTFSTSTIDPYNSIDVEREVRIFFADSPVMIQIAKCESEFRQFDDQTGKVLNGGAGDMIGVFQIYRPIHAATALGLGFNIETLEGNLGYAKHLYKTEGTRPWNSSFSCWNKNNVGESITTGLGLGMTHSQVLTLQRILNKKGFILAAEGPGSLGNETTKFGNLTRAAVRRFQCAQKIICSGDEYSTGYGFVGPRTRAALMVQPYL